MDSCGHSFSLGMFGTWLALQPCLLESVFLSHEIKHEINKIPRWVAIYSATMKLTPTTHMWDHNSGDNNYQSALEKMMIDIQCFNNLQHMSVCAFLKWHEEGILLRNYKVEIISAMTFVARKDWSLCLLRHPYTVVRRRQVQHLELGHTSNFLKNEISSVQQH